MKTRIVKVLGFLVLNIVFFTILLGFAHQADQPAMDRVDHPVLPPSEQLPQLSQPGNEVQHTFHNPNQKLVVMTAAAEFAIK